MHSFVPGATRDAIPRGIPGLYAWYRYDNVELESGNVKRLFDRSGNNIHAVQTAPTLQPFYYVSGGQNNKPYWESTTAVSSGRCLLAGVTGSGTTSGSFDFLHNGSDWTIVYVMGVPTTGPSNAIMGTQYANSNDIGFQIWHAGSNAQFYYMGGAGATVLLNKYQNPGFPEGVFIKCVLTWENAATPAFSGSVNGGTTTFTGNKAYPNEPNSSRRRFGIGCNGSGQYSTNSKFHEILIYNRKMTTDEISRINYYLKTIYNL